jgi:transcriptional regulator with XRE-family HTH domain
MINGAPMKIENTLSEDAVLAELGRRLARRRLDRGLTQAALAAEAGISKSTVERIESGASTQLTKLIRLLRPLDLLDNIEMLAPEPTISPIDMLKLHGKQRQRASSRQHDKVAEQPWTWGDKT